MLEPGKTFIFGDGTRKELTGLSKKYKFVKPVFTKNRGYGASIFAGLKKAKGEYICWTHGDIQTPPKDTIKAYKIANNRKNILVKGNRKGRPFTDSFFTAGMSVFEFLILGKIFRDINAQPNLFHKSFLKQIKNPPKDFAFDLFIYHLAKKLNYKIIRFPVTFEDRIHGESSWNKNIFAKWKFIKRTMKFSLELRKKL